MDKMDIENTKGVEITDENSKPQSRLECLKVDRTMLPSKLAYFFSNAYLGSYIPYLNIFLTSVGLSPSQAGFITGIRTISMCIAGPIWGALADHTGRRKVILALLCIGTVLLIFPLPWVARTVNPPSDVKCFQGYTATNSTFNMVHHKQTNCSSVSTTTLFYVMLSIMLSSAFFDQSITGYIDPAIMNILSTNKDATFGNQRLFGSIGYGVANLFSGIAADNFTHSTLSSYTAIFFVFLAAIILFIPAGQKVIKQANWDTKEREYPIKTKVWKTTLVTCCSSKNLLFLVTVLVGGIAGTIHFGFLFLFIKDEMHGSKTVMGLNIIVACLAEASMYPFTSRVMTMLGGSIPSLIIGVFSYTVRLLLLSFITKQWWTLPFQLLHSLGSSLYWTAAVSYVNEVSPKEISSTMFGLLTSLRWGLGTFISNMAGGVLYDAYGGKALFRGTALLIACWCAFVSICFYRRDTKIMSVKKDQSRCSTLVSMGVSAHSEADDSLL